MFEAESETSPGVNLDAITDRMEVGAGRILGLGPAMHSLHHSSIGANTARHRHHLTVQDVPGT